MKVGQHGKDAALEEQVYLAKWKRKGAERQRRTTVPAPKGENISRYAAAAF